MPDYPITPGAITVPFCPTTWQQVLEEISSKQTVTLPSINGFIAQDSTPGVTDQDKVWIKTSVSAPYVVGVYVYQGGSWRPVPAPVGFTYFVDTGAANVWTITTGESIPDNAAFITGRLWAIRVNASISGATTLQIDSFTAKGVKKQNDNPLVAGDVEAGQVVLCIYDATAGEFELITTLGAVVSPYKAATISRTGVANTSPQSIPANVETTIEFDREIDPSGFVTLAGHQFTLPTGTYVISIFVPCFRAVATGVSVKAFLRDVTGGNIAIAYATAWVPAGGTGADTMINAVVTVSGATNMYDARIYASGNGIDLGVKANIGTYDETYQSANIIKIA